MRSWPGEGEEGGIECRDLVCDNEVALGRVVNRGGGMRSWSDGTSCPGGIITKVEPFPVFPLVSEGELSDSTGDWTFAFASVAAVAGAPPLTGMVSGQPPFLSIFLRC